jgi:hypothetical protein
MIIKVALQSDDEIPEVYRVLQVPGFKQMGMLHKAIQASFGLWNYHLYQFDVVSGGLPYRVYSFKESWEEDKALRKRQRANWENLDKYDQADDLRRRELRMNQILIGDFLMGVTQAEYQYDFGAGWRFDITVLEPEAEDESENFFVLESVGPDLTEDAHYEFLEELKKFYDDPSRLLRGEVDLSIRRVVDQNLGLTLLKLNDGTIHW